MNRLWVILWCFVWLLLQESQQLGLRLSRRKEACCYFAHKGVYPQDIALYSPEELNFHRIWKLSDNGIRHTCFPFLREKLARIYRPVNLDKEKYYKLRDFFYKTQNYRRWSGCRRSNIFGEYLPRENVLQPENAQEEIRKTPTVVGRFKPTSPGYHKSFLGTQETEAAADSMEITIGYEDDFSTPDQKSSEKPMYSDIFYIPSEETMNKEPSFYLHSDRPDKKKVLIDFVDRFGGVSEPSTTTEETTMQPMTTETNTSEEPTTRERITYRIYEHFGQTTEENQPETTTPEPSDRNPWNALTDTEIESHLQINEDFPDLGSSITQGSDEKYPYLNRNHSGSVEEFDEATTTAPIETTTTTNSQPEDLYESVEILDDAEEKMYENTYSGRSREYQNEDDLETTTTKLYNRFQYQTKGMTNEYPLYSEYEDETVDETTVRSQEEEDTTTERQQETTRSTYEQESRTDEELPNYDYYTINEEDEDTEGYERETTIIEEDTTRSAVKYGEIEDRIGYKTTKINNGEDEQEMTTTQITETTTENNEVTATEGHDHDEDTYTEMPQSTTKGYKQDTTTTEEATTNEELQENSRYEEHQVYTNEETESPQLESHYEATTDSEGTTTENTEQSTYTKSVEIEQQETTTEEEVTRTKDIEDRIGIYEVTTTEEIYQPTTDEYEHKTTIDEEGRTTEADTTTTESTEIQQRTTKEYHKETTAEGITIDNTKYEEIEHRIGISEYYGNENPSTDTDETTTQHSEVATENTQQPTSEEYEQETTTEKEIMRMYTKEIEDRIGLPEDNRYEIDAEDDNAEVTPTEQDTTTTESTEIQQTTTKEYHQETTVDGVTRSNTKYEEIEHDQHFADATTTDGHEIPSHQPTQQPTFGENEQETTTEEEVVTTEEGEYLSTVTTEVDEVTTTEDIQQSTTDKNEEETTTEEDITRNTTKYEYLQDRIGIPAEGSRYEIDAKDDDAEVTTTEDTTPTESTENQQSTTKEYEQEKAAEEHEISSIYEDIVNAGETTTQQSTQQRTSEEHGQETTTDKGVVRNGIPEDNRYEIDVEDNNEEDQHSEEVTTTEGRENPSDVQSHYIITTEPNEVTTTDKYEEETTTENEDTTRNDTKYEQLQDRIRMPDTTTMESTEIQQPSTKEYQEMEGRIGSEEEIRSLEEYGFSKEEASTGNMDGMTGMPEGNYGSVSEEARAAAIWEAEISSKEHPFIMKVTPKEAESPETTTQTNSKASAIQPAVASTAKKNNERSPTGSLSTESAKEGRVISAISRTRGRKPTTKPPGTLLGVVKPVVQEISRRITL